MTTIRRATSTDAAAAADVYIRARHYAAERQTIPPMAHTDDDVRRYWSEVLLPGSEVWVAVDDESTDVVAVMALEGDWLDQLYVLPGWTDRGIGADLLNRAKRERRGGLQLWAFQSNVSAHRFYERHGFVEAERTAGLDNEERSPDVRYMWNPQ